MTQRAAGYVHRMLGEIIAAIIIGIIAGYLGRLLLPGRDPMGFVQTVILGIVGSLVGFFIFTKVGSEGSIEAQSFVASGSAKAA